jgi:hypothetical protein
MEELTLKEAFYMTMITLSTVGYGDLSPQTQNGRIIFSFFIPIGTSLLVLVAGHIIEFQERQKAGRSSSIKQLLEMDGDGNGEVNLEEFQLHMLVQMGKVDPGMLEILEGQFRTLDKSGDGMLSAADIADDGDGEDHPENQMLL